MAIKNKYKVEQKYITNKLARGGSKLKELRYFVAHETANNSANADAHYKYFQNIKIQASAHTFVDDNKILEIIPIDEKAWHVKYNNDKQTLGLGLANDYAIGTELCRTGSFKGAYDRYVWYHAYLCKKFGKQPKKHITAHKFEDPARRRDPQSWLEPNGVTWGKFISDVQKYYDNWEGEAEKVDVPSKPVAKPTKNNLAQTTTSVVDYLNATGQNSSFNARRELAKRYGMSKYSGTAKENTQLLNALRDGVKVERPKPTAKGNQTTGSIVEYLNSIKVDSSYRNRAKLAKQYGISNYSGTASQNTQLLNKLRGGRDTKGSSFNANAIAKQILKGIDSKGKRIPNGHANRQKHFGLTSAQYEQVRKIVNKNA